MALSDQCLRLVRKYGAAAKVVATGVLNVIAPGSGKLIELAGTAIDAARDVADKTAKENWERALLAHLQRSEAETTRLAQLFEKLAGPLAAICDKAFAFADQPDDLPDLIARAIAADPKLTQVLHEIGDLKEQFDAFQADVKRLADRQDEAAPVYVRMNRVADYFDELWQAGVTPKVFARCMHDQAIVLASIERNETDNLDPLLLEMRTVTPKAASVLVLEAAVATREFDYPAAQRALATAVRLKPGDTGLADLSRRVTKLATRATPTGRPPQPAETPGQPRRLQPGDTLDGWLLESRLGAGGWGQVFKATKAGQTRAVKVMHTEYAADRAFVERFQKEIETLIKLPRHANLVRIEGWGFCRDQQTWYLAMEYVDGLTLEQHLKAKGPFDEAQVRQVFPHAIEGLAKAHAAGIVHRDVKPSNLVFRTSDGRLVFVDFGLAVGVEDFGNTKVSGITVTFAAPEQHYGERATQASDVFSFCAVMHYALQYDKPEQRKPHRFTPNLAPKSLRDVMKRGMATNVEKRLADACQLLDALMPMARPAEDPKPVGLTAASATDYARLRRGKVGDVIEVPLTSSLKMKFAWVPPGTSWLDGGGDPGQRQFTLNQGLWCGTYSVTQAEWQAVMGDTPSHFKNKPRHPVESVSWDRVQRFLDKLNGKLRDSGLSYRLPTEEEWEYICRGGPLSQDQSKYHFYFAKSKTDLTPIPTNDLSSKQANFDGNHPAGSAPKAPSPQATSEVGLYLPNSLGIYDLVGNVWEWTSSEEGWTRVIRGGSWDFHGVYCTASYRLWRKPDYAHYNLGFRLLAIPVGYDLCSE